MRVSKNITILLTDEEQQTLEQARDILDRLSDFVMDNDFDDDYDFNAAYGLLEEITAQDGQFDFEGSE